MTDNDEKVDAQFAGLRELCIALQELETFAGELEAAGEYDWVARVRIIKAHVLRITGDQQETRQ